MEVYLEGVAVVYGNFWCAVSRGDGATDCGRKGESGVGVGEATEMVTLAGDTMVTLAGDTMVTL